MALEEKELPDRVAIGHDHHHQQIAFHSAKPLSAAGTCRGGFTASA